MKKFISISILAVGAANSCLAYEVDSHAWMAKGSFDRSVLSPGSPSYTGVYRMMGWDRMLDTAPFNVASGNSPTGLEINSYYDLLGSWQQGITLEYERPVLYFEQRRMPFEYRYGDAAMTNRPWLRFEAWLMRGAIREDDLGQAEYTDGFAPDVDPRGELTRVLRHFYNPVNEGSIPAFSESTDWALGSDDALAVPPTHTADRGNHFSWADARRGYFQALTYRRPNAVQTGNPEWVKEDYSRRQIFWGTSMKSIGHVLHLLQDTAQPQHTRIDFHNHSNTWLAGQLNTELRRRTYELFTNVRVTGITTNSDLPFVPEGDDDKLVTLLGQPLNRGVGNPMPVGTYPVPTFSLPVEYFTTKVTDADVLARRGLADYSNRGFFTEGTLFGSSSLPQPPVPAVSPGNELVPTIVPTIVGNVRVTEVRRAVPDTVAPAYADPALAATGGKAPLYSISMWDQFGETTGEGPSRIISLQQYRTHADMLAPRAIAYGAGLINYFFRGRLEVTPTAQNAFAVLNQGEPHTVDADGYPRRANASIFGFEKVRLRVRNVTEAITESGSAAPALPQSSGDGTLVAVARYHRNACYRQDMSGERVRGYAPPPGIGTITEPTCTGSTPVRTTHQEISVSAPIAIASSADLPGGVGSGGGAPAAVEKTFDFSADPIPVNATDLFIQVVYRGQLGDEPDAVAVGIYDVREPTFIGIYNNTDYYWNGTVMQWLGHQGSQFPWQNADYLRVCTGASTESRWAYYAEPVAGFPPLGIPVPDPGAIRLAFLFAVPNGAQQFSVRVTPVMDTGLDAYQRSFFTRGRQKQANKELVDATVLSVPQFCSNAAPTGSTYWCDDPVSRRRGLTLGDVVAGVYYDTGFGNTGGDVDAQPLPPFAGLRLTSTGTLKWNDAALVACPPPPTAVAGSQELIELLEMAADEGIMVE